MTTITIEKGLPPPKDRFPFEEMEIGDSFLLPPDIKRMTVQVAALRHKKKTGKVFSVKKTSQGYRCWRVE